MTMIYTYDGTNSSCNLTTAAAQNALDMLYYLKQTLKQAGWTVTKSSDGTTFNSTGDQITGYGSGTGGLANLNAWFVVRAPGAVAGSTRQFLFQRVAAGVGGWSMSYSQSAGFTGGSASTVPTATDGQLILNGVGCVYNAAGYFYRYSIGADNAAPYGFYLFNFPTGGGNPFFISVIDPLVAGTYDSLDVDPYIIYTPNNAANYQASPGLVASLSSEAATTAPYAWIRKGYTDQTFGPMPASVYYSGAQTIPAALSVNPYTSNDEIFPILYGRRSGALAGYKGIGSMMKWLGTAGRSTGDTVSIATSTSKEYIVVGNIVLPWNGSTPTV